MPPATIAKLSKHLSFDLILGKKMAMTKIAVVCVYSLFLLAAQCGMCSSKPAGPNQGKKLTML